MADTSRSNIRPTASVIIPLLPPALLIVAVIAQPWIAPGDLLRDPIAVAELRKDECCSFYYGAVSNLGVLIWAVAAAVSLFSGVFIATRRMIGDQLEPLLDEDVPEV